jgi:hypothetical protein
VLDHFQAYNMFTKYICLDLLILFPFNSYVFHVSNCILLNNCMVFMKKVINYVVLSMKTFSHLVISMVTKIRLGTKTWDI